MKMEDGTGWLLSTYTIAFGKQGLILQFPEYYRIWESLESCSEFSEINLRKFGVLLAGIAGASVLTQSVLTNACRFAPNQGRTSLCCLYVAVYGSCFAVLPGVLMLLSYMGELTVWIVFPTVAIRMYRSLPSVPIGQLSDCSCMPL